MKKITLFFASALVLFALSSCSKPADPEPEPGPTPPAEEEITTNNVAPGGFADDGPQSWYE